MLIEQTIEIPDRRQITIKISPEIPAGERAIVIVLPKNSEEELGSRRRTPKEAIQYCRGLGKRLGVSLTSKRLIKMRREDKALKEAKYQRMFPRDGGKE